MSDTHDHRQRERTGRYGQDEKMYRALGKVERNGCFLKFILSRPSLVKFIRRVMHKFISFNTYFRMHVP